MYKRALVTLDGSPVAETILAFITQIAGPLNVEVVLLRVVVPVPPQAVEVTRHAVIDDVEGRLAEAGEYLAAQAAELAGRGVRVRTQVRRGDPVREIAAAAAEVGADLIAMTTHGRSGLGRALFGSVAEAVLRQVDIPVFLMRFTKSQERAGNRMEAAR